MILRVLKGADSSFHRKYQKLTFEFETQVLSFVFLYRFASELKGMTNHSPNCGLKKQFERITSSNLKIM